MFEKSYHCRRIIICQSSDKYIHSGHKFIKTERVKCLKIRDVLTETNHNNPREKGLSNVVLGNIDWENKIRNRSWILRNKNFTCLVSIHILIVELGETQWIIYEGLKSMNHSFPIIQLRHFLWMRTSHTNSMELCLYLRMHVGRPQMFGSFSGSVKKKQDAP
jgi:hypothetical protein